MRSYFISRLLVEKPDFYPSNDIVLAVLTILGHRITSKEAHDDFFQFINKTVKKKDLKIIPKYYSIDRERCTNKSIFLIRKASHEIYTLKHQMEIFVMTDEIQEVFK